MTTTHAWWLVIWGRLRCRLIRRHDWQRRNAHDYRVAWCERCWLGYLEVER